jgi:RNA polymerase primary sigma factor
VAVAPRRSEAPVPCPTGIGSLAARESAGCGLRGVTVRGQLSERELVLAAKECRGEARGALIEAFTPLIGNVARGYRGASGVGRAELMQEGVVGLLRALERYDPELETPFWAYASWWVRQAMQQLVSELSRPVVVPDRAARQLACVRAEHASRLRPGARP